MKKTWTIIGAGNMTFDLMEAIDARGETVLEVVRNVTGDEILFKRLAQTVHITPLAAFHPSADYYIFGFVEPHKENLLSQLSHFKLPFQNLIHPFSSVAKNTHMGVGNFIAAGCVLAPNVVLGNFNYINRCASIGHDSHLKDENHIAPGVVIPGFCMIGSQNMLGANSTLVDGVSLSDQIVIGAGAVVTKDLQTPGTYIGVPAKKM